VNDQDNNDNEAVDDDKSDHDDSHDKKMKMTLMLILTGLKHKY